MNFYEKIGEIAEDYILKPLAYALIWCFIVLIITGFICVPVAAIKYLFSGG